MIPLIFDIETGPLPEIVANPGLWFKPDSRLKDPEKIAASLKEKAEDAALSPVTGCILAVGYHDQSGTWSEIGSNEKDMLDQFFMLTKDQLNKGGTIIGWNNLEFDLPFILFRAWVNHLTVPPAFGKYYRGRFSYNDAFIDLMLVAQAGRYRSEGYSLDRVARAFGLPGKTGSGAEFAMLLKMDPKKAKEYLRTTSTLRINSL